MNSNSVVPKPHPLTEDEFHDVLMEDWSRLTSKLGGKGKFALAAGLTVRQLGNIHKGSTPNAIHIFNILAADETAIAAVLRKYNLRAVPADAICSSDPGTLPLATLLHHVAQAEHPESHGGVAITEHEARSIPEEELLKVERLIAHIRQLRKPKAVA